MVEYFTTMTISIMLNREHEQYWEAIGLIWDRDNLW